MPKPMTESKDAELLRAYADEKSEPAFGELVRRHVNLVYSVALRQCGGDAHLAEDVAQRVFTDLARKARSLSGHAVLGGWLYRSAQFAASDVVRAERRRRAREQEAHAMEETNRPDSAAGHADWQKLAPVLDQAIGELAAPDRDAVVLRFFEGRPFAEIGATLRLSDDAARMRVERALDKLRVALERRGITSTTVALGIALANQAAATAPVGVAASVTTAALAGAALSGGAGASLAFLTMSKIQAGIVSLMVLAGLATAVVEVRANRELRHEIAALQAARNDVGRLQQEGKQLDLQLRTVAANNPELDELARLRARAALLTSRPEGVTDELMKTITACQNVGRATPAASIETGLWAIATDNTDVLMRGYFFPDDMKASLAAFFAKQSDVVRTRYGTPEHLLAALWRVQLPELPAAFQVVEEKRSIKTEVDAAQLQVWLRQPSGEEKMTKMFLQRGPDGWAIVIGNYPAAQWDKIAARIDPATGDLHPNPK
jgi:RNA polymerase sigma factor (sigma-70 family)